MSTFLGAYQDAKRRLEEALAIHQAIGNQSGMARSRRHLALVACVEGRFEEAEVLAREEYATSLEEGTRTQAAMCFCQLKTGPLDHRKQVSWPKRVIRSDTCWSTRIAYKYYPSQATGFRTDVHFRPGQLRQRLSATLALAL